MLLREIEWNTRVYLSAMINFTSDLQNTKKTVIVFKIYLSSA